MRVYPEKDDVIAEINRRKFNEIAEWYFWQAGKADGLNERLIEKLEELKAGKEISGFEFDDKKNYLVLSFTDDSKQKGYIDMMPSNIFAEDFFMIISLMRQYDGSIKDSLGKAEALKWFENRLSDLMDIGIVEDFRIYKDLEIVDIKFANAVSYGSYGFYRRTGPPIEQEQQSIIRAVSGNKAVQSDLLSKLGVVFSPVLKNYAS